MRMGKFSISKEMIEEHTDELLSMFYELGIVPIKAEYIYPFSIEYIGISNNFDDIDNLNTPYPYYKISTQRFDNGNYKFIVEKINGS